MKKIAIILLCLAAIALSSCSNDTKRIEKAAYKYSYALGNYEFDDAFDYATEETQETLLTLYRDVIMPNTDMAYVNSNRPADITIGKIVIVDDTTATVSFHKTTPIKEMDGSVELRKRDNKWLVHNPIEIPEIFNQQQNHKYDFEGRDTSHLEAKRR